MWTSKSRATNGKIGPSWSLSVVRVKRRLRRQDLLAFFGQLAPCLVAMEACSSAHHWARELVALGHDVRLIPPQYAKPYVKRNKTDAADAEAICEAAGRPTMRFVPIKTKESQALLALHRVRSLLVRQRTAAVNSARGLLDEFGLVAPKGIQRVGELRRGIERGPRGRPAPPDQPLRRPAATVGDRDPPPPPRALTMIEGREGGRSGLTSLLRRSSGLVLCNLVRCCAVSKAPPDARRSHPANAQCSAGVAPQPLMKHLGHVRKSNASEEFFFRVRAASSARARSLPCKPMNKQNIMRSHLEDRSSGMGCKKVQKSAIQRNEGGSRYMPSI